MVWRDGCDDDNELCCEKGKRNIDYHEMKGKCEMCRKVNYRNLVAELEEHKDSQKLLQLRKQEEQASEVNDPHGVPSPEIKTTENTMNTEEEVASLIEQHLQIMEDANREVDHMEKMEALKLEQQRDATHLRSRGAANASIVPYDESLLLPPPQLKGHPIEAILEITSQLGEEPKESGSFDCKTSIDGERESQQEKELEDELERELRKKFGLNEYPEKNDETQENVGQWQENAARILNNPEDATAMSKLGEEEAAARASKKSGDMSLMAVIQEGADPVNNEKAQKEVQSLIKRLRRESSARP